MDDVSYIHIKPNWSFAVVSVGLTKLALHELVKFNCYVGSFVYFVIFGRCTEILPLAQLNTSQGWKHAGKISYNSLFLHCYHVLIPLSLLSHFIFD